MQLKIHVYLFKAVLRKVLKAKYVQDADLQRVGAGGGDDCARGGGDDRPDQLIDAVDNPREEASVQCARQCVTTVGRLRHRARLGDLFACSQRHDLYINVDVELRGGGDCSKLTRHCNYWNLYI